MYWRFGHQNASVIEHLLESGNVSLEELLEQDDLIQECKSQNPRLTEYLRDPAVLQQLLSYIISDDLEDRARFKYPFIASEVIACEVWGILESALANPDMLVKFWEFLDRPPPLNPVQASYFTKVIGVFLIKKTGDMLHFIRSQPEVVPKLLLHMSTSSIMDLLLKIISMEESPEGKGTVQWLSEQGLMPWLVNRLDPNFDEEVHSIASQVLLDIIAISQSSHPEQPSIGANVLIEELKSEVIVTQLVGFMLDRTAPYSSSTLINGVTIFIELIRRNNSDYDVEPLPPNATEPAREVVDLSDLLKVLASRIEDFKDLLVVPRSVTGPIDTSIGKQTPLGFERLKICEMFAELLHCSNMAVLNSRPIISVSCDGTVRIPTVSVEDAAHHDTADHSKAVEDKAPTVNGSHTLSAEKPVSAGQSLTSAKDGKTGSQTDFSPSTIEKGGDSHKENAALSEDDQATPRPSPPLRPSSTLASSTIATLASAATIDGDVLIPVGDFLKLQFVDHRIIPTCFDLFFQFPWNNFLHTVVYDMVHQVFHRPMGDIGRPDVDGTYIPPKADQGITEGWNRRLTISIFKDGQLTKRITDAQRLCDYECAQPKGVRLGYMGHLTYIADETVKLLELYSQTSLLSMLYEFMDLEDWWNYVSKILKETKERDAQVLGGSRPNVIENHNSNHNDANDDDDYIDDNDEYSNGNDFLGGDSGTGHEGDVASDQFARYLCQQITNNLPDKFGSSDEDEDEEEGNWIGEFGPESEFDMRRTGSAAVADDPFGNHHALDFSDDEDDEGVDEESWNAPWPATTKAAETGSIDQLNSQSEGSSDLNSASKDAGKDSQSTSKVNLEDQREPTTKMTAPEMKPMTLAPTVHATPVIEGSSTQAVHNSSSADSGLGSLSSLRTSNASTEALPLFNSNAATSAVASATTPIVAQKSQDQALEVEMEIVPLSDPTVPKLSTGEDHTTVATTTTASTPTVTDSTPLKSAGESEAFVQATKQPLNESSVSSNASMSTPGSTTHSASTVTSSVSFTPSATETTASATETSASAPEQASGVPSTTPSTRSKEGTGELPSVSAKLEHLDLNKKH